MKQLEHVYVIFITDPDLKKQKNHLQLMYSEKPGHSSFLIVKEETHFLDTRHRDIGMVIKQS